MPETKATTNRRNTVRIVGYLKENNLELITTRTGDEAIRGSITIATSEISSHKVTFYVSRMTRTGEESKDFDDLIELLPEKTISIASFLKANPTANLDIAANASTKIWVLARMEEYVSKKEDKVLSMVTLKGYRAGFKTATDKAPFVPCAEFTTDVYISELSPEYNEDGTPSGRAHLEGLLPVYNGSVQKISFVAPKEDGIAEYILSNYKTTDTVTLKGDLISIQERRLVTPAEESEFFGRGDKNQYETRFIRERRILGGSKEPIHQGAEGCISFEFVKNGLAIRETKIAEASDSKMGKGSGIAPKKTGIPAGDLDF